MGWSGGSYSKGNAATGGWAGDAATGIGIEASRHDTQDNDFATGINQCINKDGSNAFTGNPNFGGFRPTNIAAGTAAAPALCVNNDVNSGVYSPGADVWAVATNGVERFLIDQNGNIQIPGAGNSVSRLKGFYNASAPNQTYTVLSQNWNYVTNSADTTLNGTAAISIEGGASNYSAITFSTNLNNSAPIERYRVDNNGQTVLRNGTLFLDSILSSGAGTHFLKWNSVNGLVTYDSSSSLIKEDIVDCPYGLDVVAALQPRKYFRTDDQRDEIGFVADEVINVIPEVVSLGKKSVVTNNSDDTEEIPVSIAYEKLTAVLCKAIQELNTKVETLEAQVEMLQTQVAIA
jgi:hypothetical protein